MKAWSEELSAQLQQLHVPSTDSISSRSSEKRKSTVFKFQEPKQLLMAVSAVVKNRTGSVLTRQMILKSDHFETGIDSKLDVHLLGAPNFRMADLNVFGVAQPTLSGIRTVLTLLRCQPGIVNPCPAYWISAREEPVIYLNRKPFVIRDVKQPLRNINTYRGIMTNRLEQMEERLKDDILQELHKWNGLVLVHEERSDSTIVPVWMNIDHIQTPRQVFETLKMEGYSVEYARIPIAPEQPPQDLHTERLIEIVRSAPTAAPLIFNCGMGLGRTTCAMVIAMLIRRAEMIVKGEGDPFMSHLQKGPIPDSGAQSIVELIHLLDTAFAESQVGKSAIEWAMARSPILNDLSEAMNGRFRIVLQLQTMLNLGQDVKSVLDLAIDRCAILMNLRKVVLIHRIRYSLSGDNPALSKAVGCLERYMHLLSLCSYLQDQLKFKTGEKYTKWLSLKPDVVSLLSRVRHVAPPLSVFQPCDDMSVFTQDIAKKGLTAWGPHSSQPATELDKYVIKSRKGMVLIQNTILKEDYWVTSATDVKGLKGASNFRKLGGFPVYGVAQPTLQGVKNVLEALSFETPNVIWINLREEPFVYINGIPYVLRDMTFTLRNLKSFKGITPVSLEIIENKLKSDVCKELEIYDGKILLHSETEDGSILPIWEDSSPDTVLSLQEAMGLVKDEMCYYTPNASTQDLTDTTKITLQYFRVPQTSESAPEPEDMDNMIHILRNINLGSTSIVINCQIGIGRSTVGMVIATLILKWLGMDNVPLISKKTFDETSSKNYNYQVIHSLLRVIRNGIECKRVVDNIIDAAATLVNIRDTIEEARQASETEIDPVAKDLHRKRGIVALDRYFTLILFQSYLDQNPPGLQSELVSFRTWIKQHPEFDTIREEMLGAEMDPLVPVDEMEPGDGIALSNEVVDVVNRRRGAVLSQGTIVKFDLFPGAQKMSLKDRIDGAHNFRSIHITEITDLFEIPNGIALTHVAGVGMPTKDGVRAVLEYMNAGPQGTKTIYWTSLREEPVIYIKGKPYVLRLFIEPIKNLVTTGIARKRVEEMENQMKRDLIQDMQHYGNRLLLHEERVEGNAFLVVPTWETVKPDDIETPLEVYTSILSEGYHVDYLRIPITDELSPIPDVFNQLVDRILSIPQHSQPIFNCQMGRGRTTQGLVITTLMKMIVGNIELGKSLHSFIIDEQDLDQFHFHSTNTLSDGVDASLEKGYKAGQYNLVLQLLAVLQYGKLAKYLTDTAIDACEHMQNLRVAIYDYRIRLAAMQPDSRKYLTTFQMGCNYLVRYFYLITFADYLIEVWSSHRHDIHELRTTFSEWLEQRKEIQNIIKSPNLD